MLLVGSQPPKPVGVSKPIASPKNSESRQPIGLPSDSDEQNYTVEDDDDEEEKD